MTELRKEYALALFELSVEEGCLNRVSEDLARVMKAVDDEPQLLELLKTPAIPMSERLETIDDVFGGSVCEYVLSFLKVLCEGGRIDVLPDAIKEFEAMVKAYTGKVSVKVISATPLSDEQKAALSARLEKVNKKEIDATYVVDPSIIGGLIIETEDKIYDGSLKGSLSSVKDVMNG